MKSKTFLWLKILVRSATNKMAVEVMRDFENCLSLASKALKEIFDILT